MRTPGDRYRSATLLRADAPHSGVRPQDVKPHSSACSRRKPYDNPPAWLHPHNAAHPLRTPAGERPTSGFAQAPQRQPCIQPPAAPAPYNVLTRFWAARWLRTSEILGTLCATRRRARQFVATPRPLPESPQCTPHHRLQPPRCSRPTARPRIPCLPAQSPATSATNRRAP